MQQQQFDQAEAAFKKAAKLDPKFREAQYNLAQIPFKKKDYAKAQERFEALFKRLREAIRIRRQSSSNSRFT